QGRAGARPRTARRCSVSAADSSLAFALDTTTQRLHQLIADAVKQGLADLRRELETAVLEAEHWRLRARRAEERVHALEQELEQVKGDRDFAREQKHLYAEALKVACGFDANRN